ncbi:golgin subfamily A member 2-like isoform X2 [Planococcus citri]|uniref:golgin subfamily A member 2-like isoform X2 n=1 Tax=Planococcus citri TaxID=170843 RepID=UPI0031F82AD7
MADMSKAEKLAAARKKLKEFQSQQRSKEHQERNDAVHPIQNNGEAFQNGNNHKQETTSFESTPLKEEKPEPLKLETASEQPPPPLTNYFSFGSKNNYFFDTLQKSASEESRESNGNEFYYLDKDKSSTSSVLEESNITHITTNNSSCISLNEEDSSMTSSIKMNEEELQNLKQELENAVIKIKMQSNALDIVMADREESDRKLQRCTVELDSYKDSVHVLQSQLEESERARIHLNELVNELMQFKQQAETKDVEFQRQVNELKEQNDELQQNLEQQKEKHSNLQKRYEEVQSSRDMLSLKIQQMGINLEDDGKTLNSMNDEFEVLKTKYAESQEQLKTLLFEKDHTDENYRQYIENLKGELQNASLELQTVSTENQNLVQKLTAQTEHISNLEKLLQKPEKSIENEKKISELENEISNLKTQLEEKQKQSEYLITQLEEYVPLHEKIRILENELENSRTDATNAHELQSVVESNKVAASQAIAQNSKLKEELVRLNACVEDLNKDKNLLNGLLTEEKNKNAELTRQLDEKTNSNNSVEHQKNDAETNTDKNANSTEQNPYGTANLDAMMQLQDKFKCVLNKMADLTDEKQQLEHLVLQLQCETETIEEYVALYQKQRSLLQQRARETDIKVERMIREKHQLQNILRSILSVGDINSEAVRQFVEENITPELRNDLLLSDEPETEENMNGDFFSLVRSDSGHHPSCPCCSGKLITI